MGLFGLKWRLARNAIELRLCPILRDLTIGEKFLVGVSDMFYLFRSGEGKEESEAPGRGGGVVSQKGGAGARGGRVSARNLGGGGEIFSFGAEIPTKNLLHTVSFGKRKNQ